VKADEIEGPRRLRDEAAAGRELARDQGRRSHRGCWRDEEEDKCGTKQVHARATRLRESQKPRPWRKSDVVPLIEFLQS
jgi:hypothetical protein